MKIKYKVLIWMVLIFSLSSIPNAVISKEDLIDTILRKSAHIFEYFILFILVYNYINLELAKEQVFFKKQSRLFISLLATFLTILYAITDEIHQSFVPGRGPAFKDVIIDTIGVILGNIYIWKLWQKTPTTIKRLLSK